jgi:hypothetical protein
MAFNNNWDGIFRNIVTEAIDYEYDPKNPKFMVNLVKELQRLARVADMDGQQAMVDINKLVDILKKKA